MAPGPCRIKGRSSHDDKGKVKRLVSALVIAACLLPGPGASAASGSSAKAAAVRCNVGFSRHGIFYIGGFRVRTHSGRAAIGVWEAKDGRRIRVRLHRGHRRIVEDHKFLTRHRPRLKLVTCRVI
jgi:hypothetical protein